MRIVIDTNVVASAIFFGGRPEELIELVLRHRVEAVATDRILAEYQATIDDLQKRHGGEHLPISAMPLLRGNGGLSPDRRHQGLPQSR